MKRSVKATIFSLIGIILVSLACVIFSLSAINGRLEDELTSSLHTSGYLRSRIRDLDAQIDALRDELENIDEDVECIQTEAETSVAATESDTAAPSPARAYRVGEYDGKIAIFAHDAHGTQPIRVLNISVMALSERERQELSAGILAADYDELCKIIDRYE